MYVCVWGGGGGGGLKKQTDWVYSTRLSLQWATGLTDESTDNVKCMIKIIFTSSNFH